MYLIVRLCLVTLSLFWLSACKPREITPVTPKTPNILLIVIDTLGAKHVGCYNPALRHTPRIDALAAQGVRFERFYATSSWTKPTIASIFTSRMPALHGVIGPKKRLGKELNTAAELLEQAGYSTMGVVSHFFLGGNSGFEQGFHEYDQVNDRKRIHHTITSNLVSDRAIDWLTKAAQSGSAKPFFMFLHYFDPHFRYQHHPDYDLTTGYQGSLKPNMSMKALLARLPRFTSEDWGYLVGLYHEEIAFTDAQIGRVFDHIETLGLKNNTLVLLTADHGEEFGEHRSLGHTRTLYDELIHVPLIISWPGQIMPGISRVLALQLDLLPTMLSLAALAHTEEAWQGISLKPYLLSRSKKEKDRDVYAEVSYASLKNKIDPNMISVRSGRYKAIYDRNTRHWQLFDIEADPGEIVNLARKQPSVLKALQGKLSELERLHAVVREAPQSVDSEIDMSPEEVKRLKSLGYM